VDADHDIREVVGILDFGSQYTQLIARRIREARVFSRIFPFNISASQLAEEPLIGLVFSGGPASVYESHAPIPDPGIYELGVPVLGICYGMGLIARQMGGRVSTADRREYGRTWVRILTRSPLFAGLANRTKVWMSHGDIIESAPPGFTIVASSANSPIAAFADEKRKAYGIQFHPEVTHTARGKEILHNFLYRVCGASGNWTTETFIEAATSRIRETVGDGRVICALSGGIDSSVTALLVHGAVGDRLWCVFVDNGLLRHGEREEVESFFRDSRHLNLRCVDASSTFLRRLEGVIDPEEKRRRIGREFVRIFTEQANKIGDIRFLAQGTLYPDVIESASSGGPASTIKTHHNVGGLPASMPFELVEPLRDLFKDEARTVGRHLGLPNVILRRQPFPGPGLAVRIVGEVTTERLRIVRDAEAIFQEELRRVFPSGGPSQAFAVLLPIRTTGVMGDYRTYEHVIALRAVDTKDWMTADWSRLSHDFLAQVSNRIINEVKGVNRVTYDVSTKPPATVEWE